MSTYGSVVWEWTYLSTYVIALHAKWAKLFVYRSLPKKGTWAEHLISLPKRGVGALSTVPHLTKKERPRHVYNDSKPSKQIIAHKITYNGITRWDTGEYSVARGAHRISYVLHKNALKVKYYTTFLTWDMHSARGCASQTPRKARPRVGADLSELWPLCKKLGLKWGWALFNEWALFRETTIIDDLLFTRVCICTRCTLHVHVVLLILTVVDCGTLTNPANGQVSHPTGTTFGQTATYSCNTGYNLVGESTRTCQAIGVWSGSIPTCLSMLQTGYYPTCMHSLISGPSIGFCLKYVIWVSVCT